MTSLSTDTEVSVHLYEWEVNLICLERATVCTSLRSPFDLVQYGCTFGVLRPTCLCGLVGPKMCVCVWGGMCYRETGAVCVCVCLCVCVGGLSSKYERVILGRRQAESAAALILDCLESSCDVTERSGGVGDQRRACSAQEHLVWDLQDVTGHLVLQEKLHNSFLLSSVPPPPAHLLTAEPQMSYLIGDLFFRLHHISFNVGTELCCHLDQYTVIRLVYFQYTDNIEGRCHIWGWGFDWWFHEKNWQSIRKVFHILLCFTHLNMEIIHLFPH